jgi:ketosteroid isomerase-like protein
MSTLLLDKFSAFYTNLDTMKVEDLAEIYSTDVLFIDPIAEHKGIAAVENYFAKLLRNAKSCSFVIHTKQDNQDGKCIVNWTMEYRTSTMNANKPIKVEGITMLTLKNDKIIFHRDYYDLGQMVYENIPLLGRLIKQIKRRMS